MRKPEPDRDRVRRGSEAMRHITDAVYTGKAGIFPEELFPDRADREGGDVRFVPGGDRERRCLELISRLARGERLTVEIKNRHKYLLQYHIIFVCKYRKKLLMPKQIADDIKQFSYEICQKHKAVIRYMETDKDHIHYMIETEPTMSISKIVNLMKSYTTYHIWERYPSYLRKHFWKEHTFWTDGYFACSVGNVSEEMLRKYIENQG